MVDKRTPHVYVEFEVKFGELWATRTLRETWWTREQFTFMWNLRQNLESSGHQEKYKSHTSVGRKFAPVEGLSHDLVCTGSIYHVHFAWQVWHGQLSPRFKFNKLKSFSGVEIDQNHVDKRILGGKGFAVGRLKRHNFCPASVGRQFPCASCNSSHFGNPRLVTQRLIYDLRLVLLQARQGFLRVPGLRLQRNLWKIDADRFVNDLLSKVLSWGVLNWSF